MISSRHRQTDVLSDQVRCRVNTRDRLDLARLSGPGRSTQAGAPTVGDAPARRAEPCMPTVGAAGTVMSGPATH